MFNVCPGCGEYSDARTVDSHGPFAICDKCGHKHPFVYLPLLIVTGASGTGKTTVAMQLASKMHDVVCMESDILWRDEFASADNDYKSYRNLWLRVAKNISQAGRPVVLFGSATPGQFEECAESRYFKSIHYLAFVCNEEELVNRLRSRPGWRKSGSDEVLSRMIQFNKWLTDNAATTNLGMTLLDTTRMSLASSVVATQNWIRECLSNA